eukprot:2599489-Ditylum_brightwellii.AAC.1
MEHQRSVTINLRGLDMIVFNIAHDCKVPQSKGYSCRHKTVETKDLVDLKQHMVATWQKWRSSRDTMTNTNRCPALIGVR